MKYPFRLLYKFFSGFLIAALLSGCSGSGLEDQVREYQQRLARVLDLQIPKPEHSPVLQYPPRSELMTAPESVEMELTQFYQLQQCALGNLVAERNTTLGKVQGVSQRLQYEQRLLDALKQCIDFLDDATDEHSDELKQTLTSWYQIKRRDYLLHWSNLITLSEELKAALSRPRQVDIANTALDISGQQALFQQITALGDPQYLKEQNLEAILRDIGAARLPATMWFARSYLADALPQITQSLIPALANIDCNSVTGKEQAEILRNVFYLFFIEKIQPVGSRINDFHYQFTAIFGNWAVSTQLPEPFKIYISEQQNGFRTYQQAMSQHIKLWQEFLGRCHLSPTAPTTP